ncbi:hypothetical protein C0J26_26615 [Pseudomonas baetica]|nr:hypothetical protein C0J26_26615 [Pseudomonas baetica]
MKVDSIILHVIECLAVKIETDLTCLIFRAYSQLAVAVQVDQLAQVGFVANVQDVGVVLPAEVEPGRSPCGFRNQQIIKSAFAAVASFDRNRAPSQLSVPIKDFWRSVLITVSLSGFN